MYRADGANLFLQSQPDEILYYRLFGELFLFLRQYQPLYPWRIVVIYPSRSIEREQNHQFGDILALKRVQRVYLDELGEAASGSLGVGVVRLVIEPENQAFDFAKSLISQAKEEITEQKIQDDLIDLITKIIVYKLPQKTRKEIEVMLGLSDLEKTKFYQEIFAEGEERGEQKAKLAIIPNLLKEGFNSEKISQLLNLPLDTVNKLLSI